jgi:DNA-binding transcriptional LysR family regulator
MELRHLRYFIAVAEEHGFGRAARRLRVAQPALSKQIRDLETEIGVALFQRLSKGVRLTPGGEVFLVEARGILERTARAVDCARAAADDGASTLRFSHGELIVYAPAIGELLTAFRAAHPEVQVQVTSQTDAETHEALAEGQVDVGCVFVAEWPPEGLDGSRLLDCASTGALLPLDHRLAGKAEISLADLESLTWSLSSSRRWPGFVPTIEKALRERGLVPPRTRERSTSDHFQVAAGEYWALANESTAAPYRTKSAPVAYVPFRDQPIPCWLALVWLPPAAPVVRHLVDVAHRMGLTVGDAAIAVS